MIQINLIRKLEEKRRYHRKYMKVYSRERDPCGRTRQQACARKLRTDFVKFYGGCCQHCGITDVRVLDLDHVNGGGSQERRSGRNTPTTMRRVLAGLLPKEDYRVLCRNCNWIARLDQIR